MKYETCDIPAKLFFEIVDKADYSLLGFKTDADNQKAFDKIYDEYFELTQSPRAKKDFEMRLQISALHHKITVLDTTLNFIVNFPMTVQHRLEIIDLLAEIGVKIDKEKDLVEQVNAIKHRVVGSLNNKLKIQLSYFEKLQKKNNTKITYEQMVANIEDVLGRNLDDLMTLRKFVAYQKQKDQKIDQQKNKNR